MNPVGYRQKHAGPRDDCTESRCSDVIADDNGPLPWRHCLHLLLQATVRPQRLTRDNWIFIDPKRTKYTFLSFAC